MKNLSSKWLFSMLLVVLSGNISLGQLVPVTQYSMDADGRVQLVVQSTPEYYYILKMRHHPDSAYTLATSITMGQAGTTTITESVGAYPANHYQVLQYPIAAPADTDGDGANDIEESQNMPLQSPLNAAAPVAREDGLVALDSFTTMKELSVTQDFVQWAEFLNGNVYLRFMIVDFHTPQPKLYFINTEADVYHAAFATKVGIEYSGDQVKRGQLIYHPTIVSQNGTLGTFIFNYSNGHGDDFAVVQRTFELLAANIPFLHNNLAYLVSALSYDEYGQEPDLYQNSRVPVLFEDELNADVNYWGLNTAEGFGYFRRMNPAETPGTKDIVLYETLPNSLPRVGGIITSVWQTPLSHVNLRAIQDHVPNAYIRNPLDIDSIAQLLDHYIYFKATPERYYIREATQEEVNNWFENIRPKYPQTPALNLNYTDILPLDSISFQMSDAFGVKCANVATMRTFGFPDDVIPNGYGVPFYFYQAFMQYNHFFDDIIAFAADPTFQSDRATREAKLTEFRQKIVNAPLPDWMMDKLQAMHQSFPWGTSVRCRSSSNVEDLPGFNGAGLYESKTHKPSEGHIAKTIKQIYASFWNLRAYEEREFHRVNQYKAAMGVLCHPNFSLEKANGVAVTADPMAMDMAMTLL